MFQTSFCGTVSLPLCRILCFKLTTEPPKAREERDNISLHICVPRASYITCALTSFLSKNARGRQLSVNYNETGTLDAISHVSIRSASMAIIRYPDRYEKTLLPLLKLRELSYETLYKFELVVIMSERHPLAKTSVLTQDLLSQAVEIVCDDTSLCTYLHESPDVPNYGRAGRGAH